MTQLRDGAGFIKKSLTGRRGLSPLGTHQLDSDINIEPLIIRLDHHAHTTLSQDLTEAMPGYLRQWSGELDHRDLQRISAVIGIRGRVEFGRRAMIRGQLRSSGRSARVLEKVECRLQPTDFNVASKHVADDRLILRVARQLLFKERIAIVGWQRLR